MSLNVRHYSLLTDAVNCRFVRQASVTNVGQLSVLQEKICAFVVALTGFPPIMTTVKTKLECTTMPQKIVLLIEGKRVNENSVAATLKKLDFQLTLAHTGQAAIKQAKQASFDLVVFNAATMRSSGVRSCHQLRQLVGKTPIIHIRPSHQDRDETAVADVYLAQPFTPRKLKNRIKAVLPADESKEEIVRCGDITYYRTKRAVEVSGKGETLLTPKLAALLEEFLLHFNQVVSRAQLMQNVWNTNYVGDTRTLDVHIRWVREAIEPNPAKPQFLRTVRGQGYIFSIPAPATAVAG